MIFEYSFLDRLLMIPLAYEQRLLEFSKLRLNKSAGLLTIWIRSIFRSRRLHRRSRKLEGRSISEIFSLLNSISQSGLLLSVRVGEEANDHWLQELEKQHLLSDEDEDEEVLGDQQQKRLMLGVGRISACGEVWTSLVVALCKQGVSRCVFFQPLSSIDCAQRFNGANPDCPAPSPSPAVVMTLLVFLSAICLIRGCSFGRCWIWACLDFHSFTVFGS
ncbi:unnamed protein product [Fraxinus pennsylvanica]|uniref:Uncharacterized protein n=1 Tax=Fraxinus pennsylvanica TaxID=56036 RepID=A0AAD1YSD7_9LAMI|nr:unnamed protein product [Fraxinus pennsylvanica]